MSIIWRTPARISPFLCQGESLPDATLNPSELAAYAAVASVLLNLDETVDKASARRMNRVGNRQFAQLQEQRGLMNPIHERQLLLTRRRFFSVSVEDWAITALASLLPNETQASTELPGLPHFAPKAKRVIYLFQHGAPSQLDLFDHKPKLQACAAPTCRNPCVRASA